jgi:molybdenum cofactor cytidylyltransferase
MLHFWKLTENEPALVSLVGGGGKTSLMVALARALVANGRSVIATTTTRIFTEQLGLAPVAFTGQTVSPSRVQTALARHGWCLVVGRLNGEKAAGVAIDQPAQWLARSGVDVVLVEADGSRMRPFKVPADHEPVVPPETTLLIPVVGVQAVNGRIADSAHRPERVVALVQSILAAQPQTVTPDSLLTPALIADLLTHPQGGLKNAPPTARIVPFINQIETAVDFSHARQIARLALRSAAVDSVLLGSARSETPVFERHERVRIVILAAGRGQRMGGVTKQLLPWGDATVLEEVIVQAQASMAHDLVVVTGHDAAAVTAVAEAAGAATLHNPDYANGEMLSSLKTAVGHLPSHIQAILVMLADQPLVDQPIIDQLLSAYWRGEGDLIAPTYNGLRGNPVLLGRAYFEELLALPAGLAPRTLLRRHYDKLRLVPVASDAVLIDLDRPQDYEQAVDRLQKSRRLL